MQTYTQLLFAHPNAIGCAHLCEGLYQAQDCDANRYQLPQGQGSVPPE